MKIGVVKEIKPDEYRVALTPAGARELVQRGHEVLVEVGAGREARSPTGTSRRSVRGWHRVDEVWAAAQLMLKVKEPLPEEYPRLREGQILFTYLHLAASKELTEALVASGATCVALRDRRDSRRRVAAARADERDRGPARGPGGRVLPGEAARGPWSAARRSGRRRPRPSAGDRRRDRRLQRRGDRHRPRRERDHPRALDRPDAASRRDPLRPGQPGDVVDAADRGVDPRCRRRHRRGPDPRREGAEADQPRRCSAR